MTTRKLIATGLAAVAGVLALTSDASAFGKRKRGNNCNCCGGGYVQSYAASGCSNCGGGYAAGPGWGGMQYASAGGCSSCGMTGGVVAGGYAVAPAGGVPVAMPAVQGQSGTVTPAGGTTNGNVVPASGSTAPDGTAIPQSYVLPQGGSYVYPAGGYYSQGGYAYPAGGYYQGGNYVYPAGGYGNFNNGFGSGVVQGALGLPSYGNYGYGSTIGGTVGNWAGQSAGRGLFRR